jgi:ABC-type nitrate/sulfonate/bicarbonate transport system substrate-binding protein
MIQRFSKMFLVAQLFTIALLVTACGGATPSPTAVPAEEPTEVVVATPEESGPVEETVEGEYTVGLFAYYGMAPFVVADAKGFFAEEEANIKLKYYTTVGDWFNAILNNKVDIGIAWNSTHVELTSAEGKKFISVGAISYDEYVRVIAKPDITPQDFTTQKVGVAADIFPYRWILQSYLKSHDLNATDIDVVVMPYPDLTQNFLAGRLNIAVLYEQFGDEATEGGGVALATSFPKGTLSSIVMSEDKYESVPKEDLKKIDRAVIKAIDWMHDPANEEELFTIMKDAFSFDPSFTDLDMEMFKRTKELEPIIPTEQLYEYNSTILEESYEDMKQAREELGLSHDFEYDEIVDTSAFLEVLEEMGKKQ